MIEVIYFHTLFMCFIIHFTITKKAHAIIMKAKRGAGKELKHEKLTF